MNENTTNNAIVLNQDSTAEEYARILRGRYITGFTLTARRGAGSNTADK